MSEPQTAEQWQDAMDAAHAVVVLEAAKRLGMLKGGPHVNLERCADILGRARAMGFVADSLAAHELLNQIGADLAVHELLVKLGDVAKGALFVAALIDTPLREYALTLYEAEASPREENT